MKWLLLAFEGISGIEVKFAKSQIITINLNYKEIKIFFGCLTM
jgi:hypothetical protein